MTHRTLSIARAVGVIGAVGALVVGATFANLNSSVTLTSSTISSASANLKVWDGSQFSTSGAGFTVTGLIPGTGKSYPFYFKNEGGVDLGITAHVTTLPASTGFADWHNLLVKIKNDNSGITVNTNMFDLNAGQIALNGLLTAGAQGNSGAPNTLGNYTITFDVVPASITGSQVTVDPFDLVFTGTQP